jgi:hypothetical protein
MTNDSAHQTHQQLWAAALQQLRLQMTGAIFDSCLKDSCLVAAGPGRGYVIRAKNRQAREWLEHRLAGPIRQTLAALVGDEVVLQFITTPAAEISPPPPEIQPGDLASFHESGRSLAATLDFEQLWLKSGFTQIPDYALRFWRLYLGRAFSLWEYLLSEDKRDAKLMFHKKIPYWTPPRRYTYRSLAAILNCSRNTLTGRLVPCWVYERQKQAAREQGRPQARLECCGKHYPCQVRPNAQGEPECLHWLEGILERLCREGLIAVKRIEPRGKPRAHELKLQVWRLLPLLSPSQEAQFPREIDRQRHRDWIERYGHLGYLDLGQWERFRLPSLVPYLPGYDWGRECPETYSNNPFTQDIPFGSPWNQK